MNTCQYAKHIVDSVPKDKSCTVSTHLMKLWIHQAPCDKDRMVAELATYLMSLEDHEHAVRVAVLVKAACPKTELALTLLKKVEQKTLFSTGAFLLLPPNPDVSDEDFVLTSLPDKSVETPLPDVSDEDKENDWELL